MIIEQPAAVKAEMKTEPKTEPEAEPDTESAVKSEAAAAATSAAADVDADTDAVMSNTDDAAAAVVVDSKQCVDVKLELPSDSPLSATEISDVDADSAMCDADKATSAADATAAGADDDAAAAEAAAAAALHARKAALSKLLPTSRSFHAEVEVTLTCPGCGYSRRLTELYRDFSLDGVHALHAAAATAAAASGAGASASGGALPLAALVQRFFLPRRLALRCEKCGCEKVKAQHKLAALPGVLVLHIKRFKFQVCRTAASAHCLAVLL
jgi:Ubiquitin carboxyl-terminal hydrolase